MRYASKYILANAFAFAFGGHVGGKGSNVSTFHKERDGQLG